ncbi:hypothetical protein SAMN05880592_101297 [Bosea sp. TND4EK4]|nr:hypothetical protein SAMN05880592_101297 [Bosea sp. TND4EK4]
MTLVSELISATAKVLKKGVLLEVEGRVPTPNWSKPSINWWVYIQPPADGIQDVGFEAEPPGGRQIKRMTKIDHAEPLSIDAANYWGEGKPLLGIRVHAAQNNIVAEISPTQIPEEPVLFESPFPFPLSDRPVPWPWSVGDELTFDPKPIGPDTKVGELTGRTVRVYKTGDQLTMDLQKNRANIELDPKTHTIVRIWAG